MELHALKACSVLRLVQRTVEMTEADVLHAASHCFKKLAFRSVRVIMKNYMNAFQLILFIMSHIETIPHLTVL